MNAEPNSLGWGWGWGKPHPSWDCDVLLHGPVLLGDVALPRVTAKFLNHLSGWNGGRGTVRGKGCAVTDRNKTVNEGDVGCGGCRAQRLPTRAQGAQACAPYWKPACHMDGAMVPSCP